jgi:bifunctional non-homologous end joining protein LigD
MNIQSFVESHHAKVKPPKADIIERWNTRVVPQGLHRAGRNGAVDYLSRYGKGISSKKVVDLALAAEFQGAAEMAAGFWEQAFFIETGKSEPFGVANGASPVSAPTAVATSKLATAPVLSGIPAHLQPGSITPMQPKDAPRPQSSYIVDPSYLGQPKRDGFKNFVFVTDSAVAHQSRSTRVVPSFAAAFDEAAQKAAANIGAFITEGEVTYISVEGKEHRTAAQAATENVNLGKGDAAVRILYSAFRALFFDGRSLVDGDDATRIKAAQVIMDEIAKHLVSDTVSVETTPTAFTTAEKAELVKRQQSEGREGEVWTRISCAYVGGDSHVESVRTIYLDEGIFTIIGLTKSACAGRSIASFELADSTGKSVGNVNAGSDLIACDLEAKHLANPGTVKVEVRYRGFTENGQLWLARLL